MISAKKSHRLTLSHVSQHLLGILLAPGNSCSNSAKITRPEACYPAQSLYCYSLSQPAPKGPLAFTEVATHWGKETVDSRDHWALALTWHCFQESQNITGVQQSEPGLGTAGDQWLRSISQWVQWVGPQSHPAVISSLQNAWLEQTYTAAGRISTWVGFWTAV